jgi:hypothetical protein
VNSRKDHPAEGDIEFDIEDCGPLFLRPDWPVDILVSHGEATR